MSFAPWSASQPPMVTMVMSAALTSVSSTTTAFVALLDDFSRFGYSMRTSSRRRSAMAGTYIPAARSATLGRASGRAWWNW